jgi:predicted nucleic acid-binding protein
MYLLDNSFVHELERELRQRREGPARKLLASFGNKPAGISVVTIGEFLRGRDPEMALAFLSRFTPIPVTRGMAIRWAVIQDRRQMKPNDAWVVATAQKLGWRLVARDKDFEGVPNLDLVQLKL